MLLPTGAGAPGTIPTPGVEVQGAGWSPEGKRVLYVAASPGRPSRVYVQDLAGGAPRARTPEGVGGWAVSPDGKFVAGRDEDQRAFLFPVDGGEPLSLPGIAPGEVIVRFDGAGTGLFLFSRALPLRIFRYDIGSGRRETWSEITIADPAGVEQFNRVVLTPDGKSYAYTFFRALSSLYVVQGLK